MIIKKIFLIVLFVISSNAENYLIDKNKFFDIIYTKQHETEAIFIKQKMKNILQYYDKSFGYKLDEKLKIVLVSDKVQVANAYSTQNPRNIQVLFGGGGLMNEYFANNSWLETLLIHETAHNYQINAKKSKISKILKKYLGNNFMPIVVVLPFWTIPNIFLPTGLTEGNAVLNESINNNGGRLYNGSLKALKNSILLQDNFDEVNFINNHLSYPYNEEKYIVGGYYMLYLKDIYGIDKVNQFFYNHSIHSINPFLLNDTFLSHFGISFDASIRSFINYTKKSNTNFKRLKTQNILATSKQKPILSKIKNKIYFITTDLLTQKKLNIFNTKNQKIKKIDTTLDNGKLFGIDGKLYAVGSNFIFPQTYKTGLFDKNQKLLKGTKNKFVQDIFQNRKLFVDISKSFIKNRLYLNDKFIDKTVSNSIFDTKGNIYYFTQQNHTRYLHKNSDTIYKFDGYYAKLLDIDDDTIYIVANTKYGSTVYELNDGETYRLFDADNIVDMKKISKNNFLLTSIDKNGFQVSIEKSKKIKADIYFQNLSKKRYINKRDKKPKNILTNSTKYSEFSNLTLANILPTISYSTDENKSYYDLTANFVDDKSDNIFSIKVIDSFDEDIAMVSYENRKDILKYQANYYSIKRVSKKQKEKDYGAYVKLDLAIEKNANAQSNLNLYRYFSPYQKEKNPTVFSANYTKQRTFPLSFFPHKKFEADIYYKYDRRDNTYGVKTTFSHHLLWQTYINATYQRTKSDTEILTQSRGVKISNEILNLDHTDIIMPSLDTKEFAKDIQKSTISFAKTINMPIYFYSLPLSIRREAIIMGASNYSIKQNQNTNLLEKFVGIKLDLLLAHTLAFPITITYYSNDLLDSKAKTTITLGVKF